MRWVHHTISALQWNVQTEECNLEHTVARHCKMTKPNNQRFLYIFPVKPQYVCMTFFSPHNLIKLLKRCEFVSVSHVSARSSLPPTLPPKNSFAVKFVTNFNWIDFVNITHATTVEDHWEIWETIWNPDGCYLLPQLLINVLVREAVGQINKEKDPSRGAAVNRNACRLQNVYCLGLRVAVSWLPPQAPLFIINTNRVSNYTVEQGGSVIWLYAG